MISHFFPEECNFSSFTGVSFPSALLQKVAPSTTTLSKTGRHSDSTVPCELSYCCVLRSGKCLCCSGTRAIALGWWGKDLTKGDRTNSCLLKLGKAQGRGWDHDLCTGTKHPSLLPHYWCGSKCSLAIWDRCGMHTSALFYEDISTKLEPVIPLPVSSFSLVGWVTLEKDLCSVTRQQPNYSWEHPSQKEFRGSPSAGSLQFFSLVLLSF